MDTDQQIQRIIQVGRDLRSSSPTTCTQQDNFKATWLCNLTWGDITPPLRAGDSLQRFTAHSSLCWARNFQLLSLLPIHTLLGSVLSSIRLPATQAHTLHESQSQQKEKCTRMWSYPLEKESPEISDYSRERSPALLISQAHVPFLSSSSVVSIF